MIENEQLESNAEPESEETSGTGDRDSLGRKKRRWGYNREQRAHLRNMAKEQESEVTDEHRLRMLWTDNFNALEPVKQAALRQRESHVRYLTGCMLLFLDRFAEDSTDLLPAVCEPCATFIEIEEYLQQFPLVRDYLPDCPTFAAVFGGGDSASGFDLDSQKVRSLIPCDGYRLFGLRVSLGGGSWPDVVDVNGAGLYYRFVVGTHSYCQKHPAEVDPHVAKAAKDFVDSRVKPSKPDNSTAQMPVAAKSPVMASVPGFIEPLSSVVQRAVLLNQAIQSDIREGFKKFKADLQEKL